MTVVSEPACGLARVLHLPVAPSVDPAPVRVRCHYCRDPFTPALDPADRSLWDLDSDEQHCCDDCYCPTCLVGHDPDQDCPSAPDPADPIAAREEAATYGNPDGRYDELCDLDINPR